MQIVRWSDLHALFTLNAKRKVKRLHHRELYARPIFFQASGHDLISVWCRVKITFLPLLNFIAIIKTDMIVWEKERA